MMGADGVSKPVEVAPGPSVHRQRGQTLVLVALLLVLFLAFLALVLDLGNAYSQRRMMQNAADAGALAGARALARDQSQNAVTAAAENYAKSLNGAQLCGTQVLSTSVVVTVQKTFPTFFGYVIGVPKVTVGAVAEAGFDATEVFTGLMPMAVSDEAMAWARDSKNPIRIWDSDKITVTADAGWVDIADGQRGWVDLDGDGQGGASELAGWIAQGGCDCVVKVNDVLPGAEGVKATLSEFERWKDKVVYIPIYDVYRPIDEDQPNKRGYHIVGFAAFLVTGYDSTGKYKYITGSFVSFTTTAPHWEGPDFGLRVVHLRR